MISTATALPVTTSEPVMKLVEEHEQLKILFEKIKEIEELDTTYQEKQKMMIQIMELDEYSFEEEILKVLILILSILLTVISSPIVFVAFFIYQFVIALTVLITNNPPDVVDNIFEVFLIAFSTATLMIYFTFLRYELLLLRIVDFFLYPNPGILDYHKISIHSNFRQKSLVSQIISLFWISAEEKDNERPF